MNNMIAVSLHRMNKWPICFIDGWWNEAGYSTFEYQWYQFNSQNLQEMCEYVIMLYHSMPFQFGRIICKTHVRAIDERDTYIELNSFGWSLVSPVLFTVVWNGKNKTMQPAVTAEEKENERNDDNDDDEKLLDAQTRKYTQTHQTWAHLLFMKLCNLNVLHLSNDEHWTSTVLIRLKQ